MARITQIAVLKETMIAPICTVAVRLVCIHNTKDRPLTNHCENAITASPASSRVWRDHRRSHQPPFV